jgi:hypothetical protein
MTDNDQPTKIPRWMWVVFGVVALGVTAGIVNAVSGGDDHPVSASVEVTSTVAQTTTTPPATTRPAPTSTRPATTTTFPISGHDVSISVARAFLPQAPGVNWDGVDDSLLVEFADAVCGVGRMADSYDEMAALVFVSGAKDSFPQLTDGQFGEVVGALLGAFCPDVIEDW